MTTHEVLSYIDKHLETAVQRVIHVMNINSHSSNQAGVNSVQDRFTEWLAAIGIPSERRAGGEYGEHLIASNKVTQESPQKRTLLVGHADTVHPLSSPFSTALWEGDTVIGPGGYDMKAGVGVMLFALEALARCNLLSDIPVRVFIVSDEEEGMPNSMELHREVSAGCGRGLVFESGRPGNLVILTRKGVAVGEITVTGKKAHSGNHYWDGANAIVQLIAMASALPGLSSREKNLTVNVGLIQGGTSATVVPDKATLQFDIRFPSMELYHETWEAIKTIVSQPPLPGTAAELRLVECLPPMEILPGSQALADSYLATLHGMGLEGSCNQSIIGGGSSASLLTSFGLPSIDALGPCGAGAHTDEEYFSVKSFSEKSKALALWLLEHGR